MAKREGARLVVLYDGACGFCNRGVLFVYRRDPRAAFRFAPIAPADTLVLVEEGRRFERSTAILRIARRLRWPWSWMGGLGLLVPRALRDWVYDGVARRRHRLAAPLDACSVEPALRARIVDAP